MCGRGEGSSWWSNHSQVTHSPPPPLPSLDLLDLKVLLVDAKTHGRALCFIVVIPTWSPDKNTRTIQKASRPSWER